MEGLGLEAEAVIEEINATQIERARDPNFTLPAQTRQEVFQSAAATAGAFEIFSTTLNDSFDKGGDLIEEGGGGDDNISSILKQKLDKALQYLQQFVPGFVQDFVSKTKSAIAMKMKELGLDVDLQKVFGFATFASIVICFVELLKHRRDGKSWKDAMNNSMGTLVPSFITMSSLAFIRKLSEPAVMKGVIQGMAIELSEEYLSLLSSSLITVVVTALCTVGRRLVILCKRPEPLSLKVVLKEVLMTLGDSLQQSIPEVTVYAGVAALCSPWATLVLTCGLSVMFADIREMSRQRNEYFVTTMAWYTMDIVLYIPRAVVSTLFRVDAAECRDTRYPDSLLCPITMELLDDPVYFHGMVVSRGAAMRQIRERGRDFWNVPLDMTGDITRHVEPLPRVAAIVRRARLQTVF